ncbi:putative transferase [Frankia sp. Hr75.2]|nr:putative transferase [Frankia sp. Hr75.2]
MADKPSDPRRPSMMMAPWVFLFSFLMPGVWGPVCGAVVAWIIFVFEGSRVRPGEPDAVEVEASQQEFSRSYWRRRSRLLRKEQLLHLGVGTYLCAVGTVAHVYAVYLICFEPSQRRNLFLVPLLVFGGLYTYLRGKRRRFHAQVSLSRLWDYRVQNGFSMAIHRPGETRAGQHYRPFMLIAQGAVLCGLGSLSLYMALWGLRRFFTADGSSWWILAAVAVSLSQAVIMTLLGNSFMGARMKMLSPVISSPGDLESGTYTLYLRPFKDDRLLERPERFPLAPGWINAWISPGRSEEERLSAALSWAGPMVAVGRPGEKLAPRGAVRMYLPLNDWKEPVRSLMQGASLVVILCGSGPGTLWEIGEAVRTVAPERLVLLVPLRRKKYAEVRLLVAEELRRRGYSPKSEGGRQVYSLPGYAQSRILSPRIRGLIYFRSDWTSEFVPLERPSLIEDQLLGALDKAMWPVVTQLTDCELRAR